MSKKMNLLFNLLQDESGQDLIEYALVAGLIGVVAVVAMTSVGTQVTALFTTVATKLTAAS